MQEFKEYFQLRKSIYVLLSKGFYKEPTGEYLDEMEKYLPVFREMAGKIHHEWQVIAYLARPAAGEQCDRMPVLDPPGRLCPRDAAFGQVLYKSSGLDI